MGEGENRKNLPEREIGFDPVSGIEGLNLGELYNHHIYRDGCSEHKVERSKSQRRTDLGVSWITIMLLLGSM